MKNKFITVETTYPNLKDAKNLGKILLERKLAACVQFTKVETMYFWQNKLEKTNEILVTIKSKNSLYKKIEKTIKEHHSYEIPQIFSKAIDQGFKPYLKWIESNIENRK